MKKKVITTKDVLEALIDKDFSLSYPSVAQYMQKVKNNVIHEAYIKQTYKYEDICKFDWGEVKLVIKNEILSFRMAVFTLAKSNIRFVYL